MVKTDDKFRSRVIRSLESLKDEKKTDIPPIVPIYKNSALCGYLRTITKSTLEDKDEIKRLAVWRRKGEAWFPSQFKVTTPGTKKWVKERLLDVDDRFLFMVETPTGIPIGHVGLFRFDFQTKSCEVDNVIRGEAHIPGIMAPAIIALIDWASVHLGVKEFILEVFSHNERAINLYHRCGFKEFKKIPLKRVVEKGIVSWIEDESVKKSQRYNVYMKFDRKNISD